ncbi:ABC transporter ATP-binding protein [Actinomadura sp. HBU206391]|uniref:ABC transporter ATP-binding protein n=1 Tax=Actinomadura sp. HBU206391 TaxID=2731692 RepID=UPI00164F6F23|nr:ABC transporter ATP-binding protein [Actinomadura sp. HBU206391]MBC6462308.1 ABC transporter ATP-binding protein [Actinomadura sp. HBU206391]
MSAPEKVLPEPAREETAAAGHAQAGGGRGGSATASSPPTPTGRDAPAAAGALAVLRRGVRASPELRRGIWWTIALACLGGAGRVAIPVLVQQVLDRGLAGGRADLGTVQALAIVAAVAVVGTAVVTRVTQKRLVAASEDALCTLRVKAFAHVHRLSIAHQSAEYRGRLVSRVTSDVETLSVFLKWGGIAWIVNGAIMLATLVAMAAYDLRITAVLVGVIVPLVLVLRLLQRRLGDAHDLVRSRVGELLTVVSETAQGAAVVRAYGIAHRTDRRVLRAIARWREARIRAGVIGAFLFTSGELFSVLAVGGVIVTGMALGPASGLTAGQLIAFILLVHLFLEPVTEFTEIIDHTQSAIAGWRKVLDLLDIPIEVADPDPGTPLATSPPTLAVERLAYAYRSGQPPALKDVSFTVEAGARIALVGATGSGKTTLAKLLTRLADPAEGRVLVNGIDLRDVATESLRSRLVMVPQDGFLFDTTVKDNVALGRPSATDDEIRRAFTDLGLDAWVDGLPHGLDTLVGQRGENLSVGERQLVALVRAHVADPVCLILDEATSSVDPATETRLSHALQALSEGRTSVTIAHRLATAERADEILVLDHGRLVERGPHRRLVAKGGVYARLHAGWLDVTAGGPGR